MEKKDVAEEVKDRLEFRHFLNRWLVRPDGSQIKDLHVYSSNKNFGPVMGTVITIHPSIADR